MEKKEFKIEDPVFLKLIEALKKELRLSKDGELRVLIDLQKSEEDWNLQQVKILSCGNELELTEAKKQLKTTTKKLKAAEQQLMKQEKLASLGLLTAGIAHEIKNPLNFITNFSDLSIEYLEEIKEMLNDLKPQKENEELFSLIEDTRSNLSRIHSHGNRAEGIVRSMLLHSRGGNEDYEPTDLNALIKEYVNLAFHGMRANKNPVNVEIRLDLEPGIGLIKLNPESFSRVILNLCSNAFDAMREKSESATTAPGYRPRLTISSKVEKNKVFVLIEDNGPGVPEDLKKKILTPFFTTKKGAEGTGLGLSITKEILEKHKASLNIESQEEEFTRFCIELNKN